VRAVVVQDEMNIKFGRHVCLDGIQKLAEFLRTMATMQLADDATGLQLQCGEQRRRPVAFVVVSAALELRAA
jgi:hypothetical protein